MSKSIKVDAIARLEGEGGLLINVKDGKPVEIKLDIYEPPRFFEGFLEGRGYQDVPDITARICGICPVPHQTSATTAIEKAFGIEVTEQMYLLRKILFFSEFIESHVLHIFMLQAPDLTGHESVISLAGVAPDTVKAALRMKKTGNEVMKIIGGRSIHPVNLKVGGFYSWTDKQALMDMIPDLEWGLETITEASRWAATLPFPEFEVDYEYVAVHNPDEYGMIEGNIISSKIGIITEEEFEENYLEKHVSHSNALHSYNGEDQPYLVGPLARYNLNYTQLGDKAKALAEELGIAPPLNNPFKGLLARAIETVEAFDQVINLIKAYDPSGDSQVKFTVKAGRGSAATEAPRGLLYHRYSFNEDGKVQNAKIVPPTAQNLARMESDLWQLAPDVLEMEQEEATLQCEHLVRSYDPCLSCATHFLKLKIEDIE
jgi:sulfhydrogenase subunit alpha